MSIVLADRLTDVSLTKAFQMIDMAPEWGWYPESEWEELCSTLGVDFHADWGDPEFLFDAMREAKARRETEELPEDDDLVYVCGLEQVVAVHGRAFLATDLLTTNRGFLVRYWFTLPGGSRISSRFLPDAVRELEEKTDPEVDTLYIPCEKGHCPRDSYWVNSPVRAVTNAVFNDCRRIELYPDDGRNGRSRGFEKPYAAVDLAGGWIPE